MKLNNRGFTLIELIAAVAIITLLLTIAVPAVLESLNTGKEKSYEILVSNIVTASKELYEEVYANSLLGTTDVLYQYDHNGTKQGEIVINNNVIETNLQTLVSNGFLSGSKKNKESNSIKYILNPKLSTKDNMGGCKIAIERSNSNGKVIYVVKDNNDLNLTNSQNFNICPTSDEYKKGVN